MRSPAQKSRRGASLIEALAVVALTGIVISTTSMTMARIGALNRTAERAAVRSQTRHRFFRQLRQDVHAARSATVSPDQTLELHGLRDGRDQVSYSLKTMQTQSGWKAKTAWSVVDHEVTIQPVGDASPTSVLFAALVGGKPGPSRQPTKSLLPPVESPDELQEEQP